MTENVEELSGLVRDIVGDRPSTGAEATLEVWGDVREAGLHRIGIDDSVGGAGGTLGDLVIVVGALAATGMNTPLVEAAVADRLRLSVMALDEQWGAVGASTEPIIPWAAEASFVIEVGIPTTLYPGSGSAIGAEVSGVPVGEVVTRESGIEITETEEALLCWDLLNSAAVMGSAEGLYALTRGYVKNRSQFGKPLSEIPAVQMRLGEMKIRLVQMRAAMARAVDVTDSSSVAAARVVVSSAASVLTGYAHQLHGAMGITQEYTLWPLTTAVWARRDTPVSENEAAALLGARARSEAEVWGSITAW